MSELTEDETCAGAGIPTGGVGGGRRSAPDILGPAAADPAAGPISALVKSSTKGSNRMRGSKFTVLSPKTSDRHCTATSSPSLSVPAAGSTAKCLKSFREKKMEV